MCNIETVEGGTTYTCIEPLNSQSRPPHKCKKGRCKDHCDKMCKCLGVS